MPAKNDDKRRWVEMELLVPGTPEQVWNAIATGPGMTAWFTPTTVEERVGGAVAFDFGDGTVSRGVVTAWEPPRRVAYEERGWMEGAPPVATEIVVTSRAGGQCVVRMVHSLFTDQATWDGELEGFEAGWTGFFEVLRVYLAHFAGQPAACARAMVSTAADPRMVWRDYRAALGLAGADVGDEKESAAGAATWTGVVERIRQDGNTREIMLRLARPTNGVAVFGVYRSASGPARVMAATYLYGPQAAALAPGHEAALKTWLNQRFAG